LSGANRLIDIQFAFNLGKVRLPWMMGHLSVVYASSENVNEYTDVRSEMDSVTKNYHLRKTSMSSWSIKEYVADDIKRK
jgi:hypothetical protein